MKTVIVYNHPYDGSFCHAILESAIRGAQQNNGTVDVINLDQDHFNPVMSGDDLLGFIKHQAVDEQAIDYANRIKSADKLILIFPTWWELMPAMMKGFIDKVIFPGSTFDYNANGLSMHTLLPNLKSIDVYTTMNTPKVMYNTLYGNAIHKALVRGTLKKSGLKNVKLHTFNMVKMSSDKKRVNWLKSVELNTAK